MAVTKTRRPPASSQSFSLYFSAEDRAVLKHCAKATGMNQTELVRRLLRVLAAGKTVPGFPPIPTMPDAVKWAKENLP